MRTGILLALLSAALFGASTPSAKMMLGNVDPWMMAGLLYLGAGLGLAVVHLLRGALHLPAIEAPLRGSDVPWLAAVITAGGILGPVFLMFGLARTDAAGASSLTLCRFGAFGPMIARQRVRRCRNLRGHNTALNRTGDNSRASRFQRSPVVEE